MQSQLLVTKGPDMLTQLNLNRNPSRAVRALETPKFGKSTMCLPSRSRGFCAQSIQTWEEYRVGE